MSALPLSSQSHLSGLITLIRCGSQSLNAWLKFSQSCSPPGYSVNRTGIPSSTAEDELLTADEKITLVLAMVDGLRIQALLDPSRDVLALLTTFMKLIAAQPPTRPESDGAA